MKTFPLLLFISAFIACKDTSNKQVSIQVNTIDTSNNEKEIWIDDFKKFRDAVYQGNNEEQKKYFKFPIMGNEIWQLAFWGQEFQPEQEFIDQKNGFTDQDFKTYNAAIFPKQFIKALLKIKTDSLLLKLEYETIKIHENDSFSYRIIASVENNKSLLRLHYNYEMIDRDENGEVLDDGEASIIYLFEIIDKKKIMFKGLEFAG